MMEELIKRLRMIKVQAEQLLARNSEMSARIVEKDREIARLKQLLEIQNNTLRELEDKLKVKRIAEEAGSEIHAHSGKNRDLKFKINEMIREVDKVIALLHQ